MQTHNVALASPVANFVVSMNADGRVASQGSLANILAVDADLSNQLAEESKEIERAEEEVDEADLDVPVKKSGTGKLIMDEEIALGNVGWQACEHLRVVHREASTNSMTVKLYLFGLGGRRPYLFWLRWLIAFLLAELTSAAQVWFLGYWAQQYEDRDPREVNVAL